MACGVAFGYGEARRPHLDINDADDVPALIVQLDGPPGRTVFPQLNLEVVLKAGDVIIAPTSRLIHLGGSAGTVNEERITAVFYTCRHVESIIGRAVEGGRTKGGLFDDLLDDDIIVVD